SALLHARNESETLVEICHWATRQALSITFSNSPGQRALPEVASNRANPRARGWLVLPGLVSGRCKDQPPPLLYHFLNIGIRESGPPPTIGMQGSFGAIRCLQPTRRVVCKWCSIKPYPIYDARLSRIEGLFFDQGSAYLSLSRVALCQPLLERMTERRLWLRAKVFGRSRTSSTVFAAPAARATAPVSTGR